MSKRLTIAGLWSLAALYAGSTLHGVTGLHELVGPVIGLGSAGLIVIDPFGRLADRVPAPIEFPAPLPREEASNGVSRAA